MGVMSSSVHSPGDHGEESLPLPPGNYPQDNQNYPQLLKKIILKIILNYYDYYDYDYPQLLKKIILKIINKN